MTVSKLGFLAILGPRLLEFSGGLSLQTDTPLGSGTRGRWWFPPHELDQLGGDTAREGLVQEGGP